MKSVKSAIQLYAAPEFRVTGTALCELENIVVTQSRIIRQGEREYATRALLIGLAMHRLKESMKHGEWTKWKTKNLGPVLGKAVNRTAQYYMALANAFVVESKVTLPEFLALPGSQTELALDADVAAPARRFMGKVQKFVGEHTLSELLEKHDIKDKKKLGGPRTKGDEGEDEDDATPEQLTARAREDLAQFITLGRQLLLQDNVCQHLGSGDIKSFDASLKALCAEWRASLKKTLGEAEAA